MGTQFDGVGGKELSALRRPPGRGRDLCLLPAIAVKRVARMVDIASSKRDDDFRVSEFGHMQRKRDPHLPIADRLERDCPQLRRTL
jgi:hypothetical protein